MKFDDIWQRIVRNAGQTFHTKLDLPFTYEVSGDDLLPFRNGNWVHRYIPKKDIQYVHDNGPYRGPSEINQVVQGPSYVWAIMNDKRITG